MFKKFVSLAIVLMLVMSMAAVAVSAAQVEISENAADTPAEVGAEGGVEVGADGGADTSASGKTISFDPSGCGWNNYTVVMVYIYEPETGEVLIDWASKKKGGMTQSGSVWTYDFDAKSIAVESGKQYSIIFNTDTGAQTHDLLFDTSCFGDTAVGGSEMVENPADSNKKSNIARWKSGNLGPALCITSLGHVVPESGGVIPAYTTAYKMFVGFLAASGSTGLQNALNYAEGKTAQELIDETASKLGLYKGDVKKAIAEAAKPDGDRTDSYDWSKDWDESKSTLTDGENEDAHKNPSSGTTDNGGSSGGSSDSGSSDSGSSDSGSSDSGDSSSDGSGGSSGSSGSGGSSGSSGTSGSGSGSSTGQETTVLFIMLGVMVVAAGVIFFIRKKSRA